MTTNLASSPSKVESPVQLEEENTTFSESFESSLTLTLPLYPGERSLTQNDRPRSLQPSFSFQHELRILPPLGMPPNGHSYISRNSNFKYRLWFIWHMGEGNLLAPPWQAIMRGDANGDLWLWEDEDEQYIRRFFKDLPSVLPFMQSMHWHDACRALGERLSRTTVAASPLVHLTPQTRLRFIAWLIVAGLVRKNRIAGSYDSVHDMIDSWAVSTLLVRETTCGFCGVSDVLPIWIETMLEVYLLDDLRSLPWGARCQCFHSQLTNTRSEHLRTPAPPLERYSPVLRVLYEIIVYPWPLIHWVTFRTAMKDRTDLLPTFLDILCGSDRDIFIWDTEDDADLIDILAQDTRLECYPQNWGEYMVEIPLETWVKIMGTTWVENRIRLEDNLTSRLAAVMLVHSSTPIAFQNILVPLHISIDDYPFTSMARAFRENYKERLTPANFESEEFWVTQNLEEWSSARSEILCHAIWHKCPASCSTWEHVQIIDPFFNIFPQNLAMYTHSFMLQQPDGPDRDRGLNDLLEFGDNSVSGYPDFLIWYSRHVEFLLGLVKSFTVKKNSWSLTSHTISLDVCEHLKRDIVDLVAELVLSLRNPTPYNYKTLLAHRETDAQRILDLLQDLLDLDSISVVKPLICKALLRLSRASGLHPRCFALSGLQKSGQQVTGGGFGDIWKGLVHGQAVSLKVMRIFEDSDIEAVLKEFSREAVIWRQLCHPNILPFFGVYHLENRLCLVSPWMENGNVMKYLAHQSPSTDNRLSLILDVALGLEYLHREKVIHGDLKGLNILVTPSHRACIADFGVSSIANAMTVRFTHSTAVAQAGTARYQAPELFQVENPARIHFGSDVYAFGCVSYEIMTGNVPFSELQNDMAVMMRVAFGHRPLQPLSCSGTTALNSLWELMRDCWQQQAETRPSASQIVQRMVRPSIDAKTTASPADWDDKFTSKFRRSLDAKPLLPSVTQIERILFGDEVVEACQQCFQHQEFSDSKKQTRPLTASLGSRRTGRFKSR